MRYRSIFRIMALILVLSLFFTAAPLVLAQTPAIVLGTSSGSIGTRITVTGTGMTPSTDTTIRNAALFFTTQAVTTSDTVDSTVTVYEKVRDAIFIDEAGTISTYFDVPSVLNDGSSSHNVTAGTYYVFLCYYMPNTTTLLPNVRAYATFTVTAGSITLSPTNGQVGTEVTITGVHFSPSQAITLKYAGATIGIAGGDTQTNSSGAFNTRFVVPKSPSGAQTVSVTVAGFEAKATFTVKPSATFSPTSGKVDDKVTATGDGFSRRKEVTIYFNGKEVTSTTTDANGSFAIDFKVPNLAAGSYDLEADDNAGNLVKVTFRITGGAAPPTTTPPTTPAPTTPPPTQPPVPSISLNPNKGTIGTMVAIGGSGFKEGATISVKFDGTEVAKVQAQAMGMFVATFKVPSASPGDHAVTVSDGTKTETLKFTVEVSPPSIPQPKAPAMGTKIKIPQTFDWEDVSVENPPVTYDLQIANSKDFTSASIIFEKKGITRSEYKLTESDAADLEPKDTPYYWRIRAVDKLGAASSWTGAGEFYLPQGFKLPQWAMYALGGLGGLFLLLFGYWLGRRSAYV